jgi:hypothetical protein
VTAWYKPFGSYYVKSERRYIKSRGIAARITYIDGKTIDGVERPWRMTVFRDGAKGPIAWWYYATLAEAIAGADDELSAIVPGLSR